MKQHVWTEIAPEANADGEGEIWKWCIRCGALKLDGMVFLPGPKQKLVMEAVKDLGCTQPKS